ncbi:MAG: hypothetical protein E2O56_07470 [Gammaproteobacteria bacterium]|nr:MAG: hypothetical protein E2O56_07470 [Gammaproteobacteria bacterium]
MQKQKILGLWLAGALTLLAATTSAQTTTNTEPWRTALSGVPGGFGALSQAEPAEKGIFLPTFGNWFDLANPGWGLDIQRVGDLLFVVWFIYRADGTPIWYVAVGELTGMSWTGTIDVFSWNVGTSTATPTNVGTMTITWSDETMAAVTWTLNGQPGGADIEFATFATGPTLANLTGHYFPFFFPGWGFTLLTQGDVTVMTIYFYRNGEPIWAQGVVGTPGFSSEILMNYFFAPDLCPECLSRKGAKGAPIVDGLGTLYVQYNPGVPTDVTVLVDELFAGSPVPNTFADIEFGPNSLGTSSSITSAYQDNFDPDYGGLPSQLPTCVEIKFDPGAWEAMPINTDVFSSRFFRNVPTNGYFDVYDDPGCTSRWQLMGPDLQMHNVGLAASFTGDSGVQLRVGAMILGVFDDGVNTCDEWFGLTFFGSKEAVFDGQMLESLEIHGTGATRGDVFFCTDGLRVYVRFGVTNVDFTNQEFVMDPNAHSQLELVLQF